LNGYPIVREKGAKLTIDVCSLLDISVRSDLGHQ
jgi:hypothetical protein